MRQPRKVPMRKRSQARTSNPMILAMKRIFRRFGRPLKLRRQDVADFAATSASCAELAHRVNFIIAVIKEDFREYMSSFLYQALLWSASDVMISNAKMQLIKTPTKSINHRYYEIYPIIPMSPDPIRCWVVLIGADRVVHQVQHDDVDESDESNRSSTSSNILVSIPNDETAIYRCRSWGTWSIAHLEH